MISGDVLKYRKGLLIRKCDETAIFGSSEFSLTLPWNLIVTMDVATSEVYSGFFVAEEGTMSTFRGLGEVIAENGLFCLLYADRASHYWHTPEAGGGVDKDNPTQVGRALAQLGIES